MRYTFQLALSHADIVRYYRGEAAEVKVRCEQGQTLRFAVRHLRPFLTASGIHGRFELKTDPENRFKSLKRLD